MSDATTRHPMTVSGQVSGDQAVSLANRQNLDVLLAVFAALDTALGRDWRNRDADAGAAITRLAEEAERRGEVKALSQIATAYGDERVGDLTVRGNVEMFARSLARAIESGEVTP